MVYFSVIQELPKASEKLYILKSIEVPISDLSKHVLQKMPENIVLASPSPLRHESCTQNDEDLIKFGEDERIIKNINHEYDETDVVSTKNIPTVQSIKKLIRKMKQQREQKRTRSKTTLNVHDAFQITSEHNSDLSTPLRSLTPDQEFADMTYSAVDLTMNNKEMDEFLDTFSIGTDESESDYDLIEILQMTEPQPPANDKFYQENNTPINNDYTGKINTIDEQIIHEIEDDDDDVTIVDEVFPLPPKQVDEELQVEEQEKRGKAVEMEIERDEVKVSEKELKQKDRSENEKSQNVVEENIHREKNE